MKKLNLIGLCLLSYAGIQAAPLTPGQALERLNDGRMHSVSAAQLENAPVWTAHATNGAATAYVFNKADGKGFTILSADDAAYAVLGYSDEGSIDVENMAPAMKWWLAQLGDQLQYYISKGVKGGEKSPAYEAMSPIAPLTKTKWNQDAPYNNDCPKIGNDVTYTGCVATSMAQVMKYHNYPEVGHGSNSYYWSRGGQNLSIDFSAQAFDWENMLDQYYSGAYNSTQSAAVAFLMKSCGYSVNMGYGLDASGAQGPAISYALKEYFDYDQNINVKYRVTYSASAWASLVHDNLRDCGPVILNGHGYQEAGHSFICDGYNGDGYFHFNWGWGGMSDGWYLMECMNPESQGIGGASMGSAFNYGVNGIFGIRKPTGQPADVMYGNVLMYGACTAKFVGNQLVFSRTDWYPGGWYCASDHSIRVNMGIIIEPVDGTSGEVSTVGGSFNGSARVNFSPGSYFPTNDGPVINFPTNLPDGRYKVTIAVMDLGQADAPYNPILCPYGAANYVYVNIENGSKTIENVPTPEIQPESLVLESSLYYSRFARYKVKVKNSSDFELTETLSPALLLDNKVVMVGGVAPITCNPNTENEIIWDARMSLVNGYSRPTQETTYTLAIVNPVTNAVLGTYGDVTMEMNPSKATLRATSLSIENSTKVQETTDQGSNIEVFDVADGKNMTVNLDYYVWSGYFDGVVTGAIYKSSLADIRNYELVQNIYSERGYMEEDESVKATIPVDFEDADPTTLYSLQFTYTSGSEIKPLRSIYFRVGQSGINEVLTDQDSEAKYYNLQGIEISSPVKGQIVIVKKGNMSSKIKF